MSRLAPRERLFRALTVGGWVFGLCAVFYSFLSGFIPYDPYSVYVGAAGRWWLHRPLYETWHIEGFQYLPQAALLVSPFARLGYPDGDMTWRAVAWLAYATGLRRLGGQLSPQGSIWAFVTLASYLAAFPALAAFGIGQINLPLAALMVHAVADLNDRRWSRASFWLVLGLALKPLMVVLLLLVAAHYPSTRRPIALGCVLMVVAPFCFAPSGYVLDQYRACFVKLQVSSRPDLLFEDVRGLGARAGFELGDRAWLLVRALAALGAFALSTRLCSSLGSAEGGVRLLAIAALYLVLFNPRTQSNSYVLAASPIALLSAQCWFSGRRYLAIAGGLILLSWCTYHEAPSWGEHLIKPVGAIMVAIWLSVRGPQASVEVAVSRA
jgi:hypothetical protein